MGSINPENALIRPIRYSVSPARKPFFSKIQLFVIITHIAQNVFFRLQNVFKAENSVEWSHNIFLKKPNFSIFWTFEFGPKF